MNVLVFGAGMIGTLLAAKLHTGGHRVTVFGRGRRLAEIAERGLRLRDRHGAEDTVRLPTLDAVDSQRFDWALATIRGDQVDDALPTLAELRAEHIMLLANHAGDFAAWQAALGPGRLTLGFPGASGTFDEHGVLDYRLAPRLVQPTTLGELDGRASERVTQLAAALVAAGVPTVVSREMQAWMRTHVAWISVFALLSAASGYDARRVRSDAALRRRAADAVAEALAVTRASGVRLTPAAIAALGALPSGLVAGALGSLSQRPELLGVLENDGPGRRAEMRYMAEQMLGLADRVGHPAPNYRALFREALEIAG